MEKRCFGCMEIKTESPVCEHCGFDERQENASHQLPVGTVLHGQYMVGKVLGQGGFGITYLGWDQNLETTIAIKEYFPRGHVNRESAYSIMVSSFDREKDPQFQSNKRRFIQEARVLAKLEDIPQVVRVKNFFEENNTAYIIMEYIKGRDLRQYVQDQGGKLTPQETFRLIKPTMEALTQVHAAGLVHRDISPDNIMLLPNGKTKLLDFGAVRYVEAAGKNQALSRSTQAILKHGFAPIEQYQSRGSLGPWTDVYALCATIYYCLTGEIPPEAGELIMDDISLDWGTIPGLTEQLRTALEKGFALRPADRTSSVEELYQGLFENVPPPPQPTEVTPKTLPPSEPPHPAPPKKKWQKYLVMALLGLAIGLGMIFVGGEKNSAGPAPGQTPVQTEPAEQVRYTPAPADPENMLMTLYAENEYAPAFGTEASRNQVCAISFLTSLAGAAEHAADVSVQQNGKVLAWAEKEGDLYHIYIGAEGGVFAPEDCSTLFGCMPNLKEIDFGGTFCTERTRTMYGMFYDCEKLEILDVGGFDTKNVTDMSYCFSECYRLEKLNVSGFDTASVTNMRAMFQHCESVTMLHVGGFDTAKVTDMSYMFKNCKRVKALNVSNFDMASATTLRTMFQSCENLTELAVENWNTQKVTDLRYCFGGCSQLQKLDLSGWDVGNVTSMEHMLSGCPAAEPSWY